MSKFTLTDSKGRGRPRENRGDKTGAVRVTLAIPGVKGNITRSFTVADAKVSAVSKVLVAAFERGRLRQPEKPVKTAGVPPVPEAVVDPEAVASA
jgi:hypothetical protein